MEKAAVVEYVTSWEERGIEKGLELGRAAGRAEALREMLLEILATRFGPVNPAIVAHVTSIPSPEKLKQLTHRAVTATSTEELGLKDSLSA